MTPVVTTPSNKAAGIVRFLSCGCTHAHDTVRKLSTDAAIKPNIGSKMRYARQMQMKMNCLRVGSRATEIALACIRQELIANPMPQMAKPIAANRGNVAEEVYPPKSGNEYVDKYIATEKTVMIKPKPKPCMLPPTD